MPGERIPGLRTWQRPFLRLARRRRAAAVARSLAKGKVVDEAVKALKVVAAQQQKTLAWIRSHGIVFDGPLGADPKNWENVAFSIYTDLCEVDVVARAALKIGEE